MRVPIKFSLNSLRSTNPNGRCQLPVVVQVLAIDGLEGDSHKPGGDAILDWQHVQGVKG